MVLKISIKVSIINSKLLPMKKDQCNISGKMENWRKSDALCIKYIFSCGAFIDLLHLPAQILILDFHYFFNFPAKKLVILKQKLSHTTSFLSLQILQKEAKTHTERTCIFVHSALYAFLCPDQQYYFGCHTVAFFLQKKQKKLLFAVLLLYLFDREMNANSLLASVFGPRKLFSGPTATQFCRQHR